MANESAFNKTKANTSYAGNQSSKLNVGGGGKSRGVEHPVAEDMALYGDTRHALHTASLPRKDIKNNYGANSHAGPDPNQLRADCGEGQEA